MKILVSACLLGDNVKYNGGNNFSKKLEEFLKDKDYIKICPEMLAGLGCPRECVELVNKKAVTKSGKNVDKEFRSGVEKAVESLNLKEIDFAILQSRSPTCGVNQIYDGTFSGNLINGQGILAEALIEKGIKVIDIENL